MIEGISAAQAKMSAPKRPAYTPQTFDSQLPELEWWNLAEVLGQGSRGVQFAGTIKVCPIELMF